MSPPESHDSRSVEEAMGDQIHALNKALVLHEHAAAAARHLLDVLLEGDNWPVSAHNAMSQLDAALLACSEDDEARDASRVGSPAPDPSEPNVQLDGGAS